MGKWVEKKLGEYVKGIRGVSYKPFDLMDTKTPNAFYLLRSNNIQESKLDLSDMQIVDKKCVKESQALNKGDIVVCMSNGSKRLVGKSCLFNLEENGFCVGAFCSHFSPNGSGDGDFVFQLFQSDGYQRFIDVSLAGSAINNLKNSTIEEFEFLVPESKEEQATIAAILTTIDQAIKKTAQLVAKYERIKTGLMQDLLTRGIDEEGNIRSEETHEFKDSALGRIPKEWEWYSLSELFQMKSGSTPHRKAFKKYFQNGNINWAKTLDLNEGYILTTDEKITQAAIKETSCYILPEDTILIAMYGGWEQIGRTAILKVSSSTNQAITALIEPKKEISPEFTQFSLQSLRHRWKKFAVSTRKDPNITKTDIGNFIIPFPSFSEQKLIVKQIQEVNKKLVNEKYLLEKYKFTKTGLMQDLLTGKVCVDALINQMNESIYPIQ